MIPREQIRVESFVGNSLVRVDHSLAIPRELIIRVESLAGDSTRISSRGLFVGWGGGVAPPPGDLSFRVARPLTWHPKLHPKIATTPKRDFSSGQPTFLIAPSDRGAKLGTIHRRNFREKIIWAL